MRGCTVARQEPAELGCLGCGEASSLGALPHRQREVRASHARSSSPCATLRTHAPTCCRRHKYRKARGKEDDEDASSEPSSNASERYVYTRALPRTPVS